MRHANALRCVLPALTLACLPPAQAAASATASLGPLSIELIDLAPDDGIAPALLFPYTSPLSTWIDANASSSSVILPGGSAQTLLDLPWVAGQALSGIGAFQAASRLTVPTPGSGQGAQLGSSATAGNSTGGPGDGSLSTASVILSGEGYLFSLTPHTRLTVSGFGQVRAGAEFGGNVYGDVDHAWATVTLAVRGLDAGERAALIVDGFSGASSWQERKETMLSVSFENAGDTPLEGGFYAATTVGAYSPVGLSGPSGPIPEPGAAALMLLGGLAMAVAMPAVRRRRT